MQNTDLLNDISDNGLKPLCDSSGNPVKLPDIGDTLGKLKILSLLGRGGTGVVYKAVDVYSEALRAVKIPYPENSPRDIARFRVEAKICARLDHPNIVKVHSVDFFMGVLPYAEMDFIDGQSVLEHVSGKPLPIPVALSIIILLCRALEYAGSQTFSIDGVVYEKLVHRDIKPANILISEKGAVKLTDFGLAKFEGIDLNTISGAMPGTVPYMAPEQHSSPVASVRTDVFSMGVTLYEMITGKRPFPETGYDAFARLIAAKCEGKYDAPGKTISGFHRTTGVLIEKCLDPDERRRFPSYAALRVAAGIALEDFTELDAGDVAALYFANRKHYRISVSEKAHHRLLPSKRNFLWAVVVSISIVALFGFYWVWKNGNGIVEKKIAAVLKGNDDVAAERAKTIAPIVQADTTAPMKAVQQKKKEVVDNKANAKTGKELTKVSKQHNSSKMNRVDEVPSNAPGDHFQKGIHSWRSGSYAETIEHLKSLQLDNITAIRRDSAVIIMIHAYLQLGKINDALVFGTNHMVNDAEYYILMARLFDVAEIQSEASNYYNLALTSPCRFNPELSRKRYLFRARYFQKQYTKTQLVVDRDRMLVAWKDFLVNSCSKATSPECDDARRIVGGFSDGGSTN